MQTRVSTKGQIVLPKVLREAVGWRAGQIIDVVQDGRTLVLQAGRSSETIEKRHGVEALADMACYSGPSVTIEDMTAAVHREARKRWRDDDSD